MLRGADVSQSDSGNVRPIHGEQTLEDAARRRGLRVFLSTACGRTARALFCCAQKGSVIEYSG